MRPEIMVGTGLILIQKDEIMLVKEKRGKRGGISGKWGIIGGVLENELSLDDNVLKEALEETGYKVHITDFVGIYQQVCSRYNRISVIYKAIPVSKASAPLPDEIEETRWFKIDEIPYGDLRFAHNERMIRDALSHNRKANVHSLDLLRTSYKNPDPE